LLQGFTNFLSRGSTAIGVAAIAIGGLVLGIKAYNMILGISKLIQLTWAAATGVATVAQKGLNLAMRANPIGIIITLVAGLVAALIWFFTKTELGQKIWAGFVEFVTRSMEKIGEFFKFLFTEFFPGLWKRMIEGFQTGWKKFTDFFLGVLEGIGQFFKNIVNSWIFIFESFVNGIISALNWLIRQANRLRIDVPSTPFNRAFTIGFNLPELSKLNLPRLADGGIVNRETLSIIGEAGPEAVVPLDKMGSMGATYNITVNAGFGSDGPQIAEQIVRLVRRYERNSGPVFARA
jgi:hypothetical protein